MADREIHKADGTIEYKDYTPEERARREAKAIKTEEKNVAFRAKLAQKETDKTTGKQKLLDLGLTQAEVDALTGQ
jgi:hypothetical protein